MGEVGDLHVTGKVPPPTCTVNGVLVDAVVSAVPAAQIFAIVRVANLLLVRVQVTSAASGIVKVPEVVLPDGTRGGS